MVEEELLVIVLDCLQFLIELPHDIAKKHFRPINPSHKHSKPHQKIPIGQQRPPNLISSHWRSRHFQMFSQSIRQKFIINFSTKLRFSDVNYRLIEDGEELLTEGRWETVTERGLGLVEDRLR